MKQQKNYIFFDEIFEEYINHYEQDGEYWLIKDLKNYLADLSKNSGIIVITGQDTFEITNWFIKNDLYQFVDSITNTMT